MVRLRINQTLCNKLKLQKNKKKLKKNILILGVSLDSGDGKICFNVLCVSLLKLFCRTISSNQSQESSDWSSLAAGSVQSASKQECDYEQNSDKKNTLSNLKLYQSFHFDYLITLITWRAMYGLVLQWHVNEFIYLVFIMAICNCIVLSGSF